MQSDLELLLKLQTIDYDLGELQRSKEYLPDMMENLDREIKEASEKLNSAKVELEQSKLNQANLELEIKTKEAELQKYQQQMMTIKTNKEYDALVAQIDTIKNHISNRETELLETIDRIAALDKDIAEYQGKVDQVSVNNQRQLEVLQEKLNSIGDKVSGKENERTELTVAIPKRVVSVYERVRKGKGDHAVVVVKKRACGACYKALTAKKIQDIRRNEKILTCDNCGRLLFWNDDESR